MAKKQRLKAICNRFKKQRDRNSQPCRKAKLARITDFFLGRDTNESIIVEADSASQEINFFQVNNQKRIMLNEEVMRLAEKSASFCILGQEPSTHGFNVTGLNTRHTIVQAATDKPSAYISCHKNLLAWPIENLCSSDVSTALIETKIENVGKLLVGSIYWDCRIDSFAKEAEEAFKFGREKNYTLVAGGDMNARNAIYGCTSTDTRGKKLEDLLVKYDMSAINNGKKPTCTASDNGLVIDVTLACSERAHLIQQWRVTDKETFSDHKLIYLQYQRPRASKQNAS